MARSANPCALLPAALRGAQRRFRLPPLPTSVDEACTAGPSIALAYAIEQARLAAQRQQTPSADDEALFNWALAQLVRAALRTVEGDPAYQAQVLAAREPQVEAYLRLRETAERDRRTVMATVVAIAHPAKLDRMATGHVRDALASLHRQAISGEWSALRHTAHQLLDTPSAASSVELEAVRPSLQSLLALPSLATLEHAADLGASDVAQRYLALRHQRDPQAGSQVALDRGNAANRRGAATEAVAAHTMRLLAQHLNNADGSARYRVVTRLLAPPTFPGPADRAKSEWDAAILCQAMGAESESVCLLVEAKASPEAAAADLSRLLRGLRRLSQADAGATYRFRCAEGEAQISGASLRTLKPHDHELPPQVIYCCDAHESTPHLLSAASRALLLGTPACLAFAACVTEGASPPDAELAPVWHALMREPRLGAVLHQMENARLAREAMLHPDDLRDAINNI